MAYSTVALITMMAGLVGVIMAPAMFNQPYIPIPSIVGPVREFTAAPPVVVHCFLPSNARRSISEGVERSPSLLAFLDSDWERVIWRPISVGIQVLHKIGTGSECRKEGITVRKAAHVQGVAFVIDIFFIF